MVAVVLVLLAPVVYSYTAWMMRPSSMAFFARSVEWVRADVPLGNQLVDEIEHISYSLNAPQKGGPQLTSLPAAGRPGAPGQPASGPPPIKLVPSISQTEIWPVVLF